MCIAIRIASERKLSRGNRKWDNKIMSVTAFEIAATEQYKTRRVVGVGRAQRLPKLREG